MKKSMKKSIPVPYAIAVALLVGVLGFVGGTRSDDIVAKLQHRGDTPTNMDFSSLNDVYQLLRSKYDGQLDTQKLLDGAKHGLVAAAGDPYTVYFNADESKSFNSDLNGSFEGIGAELGKRNDKLVVISTLDDSPAKKAGLQAGDIIGKVNDEDATTWSVEQAVAKIRGQKGTTVKLTVVRGSDVKEISITRDAITDPSVTWSETDDNIGIMRISRFGDTETVNLARKAADEFKAKGVKAVILDLRGNGGGYITTAQAVASLWLEDEVVVTEKGTDGSQTLRSDNDAPLKGIKTVVLVDGGSASASEIVSGALSDHGAATLVGEKTFGKGSAQVIMDAPGGGQVKITVAKWYTPNGKNINKAGITPSVQVPLTADDINAGRDPQKDKALELLR